MNLKTPCIGFRTGLPRPTWAPPVASGRFAFLEMADRRDSRRSRSKAIVPPPLPDPHHEPSERLLAAWAPIEQEIRAAVGETIWNIWLVDLHPHAFVGGGWRLACEPRKLSWVQMRFGKLIAECAGCPVVFVACEGLA